jgi:hypothetical protein
MNLPKLALVVAVLLALVCCVVVPRLPGYAGPFSYHDDSRYYGSTAYYGLRD